MKKPLTTKEARTVQAKVFTDVDKILADADRAGLKKLAAGLRALKRHRYEKPDLSPPVDPTTVRLSDTEKKVLLGLADEREDWVYPFRSIADFSGLRLNEVKRPVRALARKGLAVRASAFNEDDGLAMGSGYWLTDAGRDRAKAMKEETDGSRS